MSREWFCMKPRFDTEGRYCIDSLFFAVLFRDVSSMRSMMHSFGLLIRPIHGFQMMLRFGNRIRVCKLL